MNIDNKTTREQALEWFNSKASLEKTRLCDTNTEIVGKVRRWETLTGREIEQIYLSEHPEQAIKELDNRKEADLTSGSPDSTNPVHLFLAEENRRLKERIQVLGDALRKMITAFYDESMESDQWNIMDEAKQALNQ